MEDPKSAGSTRRVTSRNFNDLIRLAKKYGVDKWGVHWYAQHYHHHFRQYRHRKINLLEIGVGGYENPAAGGQSLRMWQEYFPTATIYGIDIYDKRLQEQGRIKIRQGSQDDEAFLTAVSEEAGGFDIIIDDGSHLNRHVIKTFSILFPLLSLSGIYAVEDAQTSYWPPFGGNSDDLNSKHTSIGFFKALIDSLNYEEFLKPGYKPSYFDRHITAMHFYHNLILIQKGENNEGSNLVKNNSTFAGWDIPRAASTVALGDHKQNAREARALSRTVNAGLVHHKAGRLDRAATLYRKALEKDPDHAQALHLLGVVAYQRGEIGSSIELIERALPALQNLPDVHLNLGNALEGAGRFAEALESYRRTIALDPDYGMAHSNLACALNNQGLFEAGLESARRAAKLIPDFLSAHLNRAVAAEALGRLDETEIAYRSALELQWDNAKLHNDLGRILSKLGRFDEAIKSCRHAVALTPDFADAHHNLGKALQARQRFAEAVESFRRAAQLKPDFVEAHFNLGSVLQTQNLLDDAVASYRRAIELKPELVVAHNNLGIALTDLGKLEEAIASCETAVALAPNFAEAHYNLGNALRTQNRLDDAVASYRRAIELKPEFVVAHNNLGFALTDLGRLDEAIASCQAAVALGPDFAEAHHNLGALLARLSRLDEAIQRYQRAIALRPDFAMAHENLGSLMTILGRSEEAVVSCQTALALRPDDPIIHKKLGAALATQFRLDDAVASFRRALALDPDDAQALRGLGDLLILQGKRSEAVIYIGRALALEPEASGALISWFHVKQWLCDWSDYREDEARARNSFGPQPAFGTAFIMLALSSTPEEQHECARQAAAQIAVPDAGILRHPRPVWGERIRLGYLSADFRQHPVAFLIAGLIERHDRRDFEVIGYSYGHDDRSAMRARLSNAFDRFVDIEKTPHRAVAERISEDGVDILIDLTGYTALSRPMILAYRPAPIQVNYLGYPGTMGAEFVDYIIVDPFVVPSHQEACFSEKLMYLPECYQCNDDKREISELTPSRAECGLPDEGFVFCCFNNSYKITPTVFDIWMQLLRATPQSVLWLLDADPSTNANLKRETAARGVASDRLVFAPRVPVPQHLARHRLADLFLDTLPYNAHTTASDALWAGLPLLTCAGHTFAGRVAGSLLRAVGLGELVTTSFEEYEALALRLAREPKLLARLRTRLAQNRKTHSLFDTDRFAGNIEAAYRQMWETWRAGRPPAAFAVSPTSERCPQST